MANKITYADKVALNENPAIQEINKVTDENMNEIKNVVNTNAIPLGAIFEYAGATAPTNWLLCQGQAISRTTYADLFAVIGTRYGAGDGSTTFNLPDKRSNVGIGLDSRDTKFNTLGKKYGEKTHKLTVAELAKHRHEGVEWLGYPDYPMSLNTGTAFPEGYQLQWARSSDSKDNFKTVYTGSSTPHNIIQPSLVFNYIIKAKY